MVNAAKNSPAVILWSIGNEIPDSTRPEGAEMARKLIADVRSIDTTRPIVIALGQVPQRARPGLSAGRDRSRSSTAWGSTTTPPDRWMRCYARYPGKFFFESESSSADLDPRGPTPPRAHSRRLTTAVPDSLLPAAVAAVLCCRRTLRAQPVDREVAEAARGGRSRRAAPRARRRGPPGRPSSRARSGRRQVLAVGAAGERVEAGPVAAWTWLTTPSASRRSRLR